MKITLEFTKSIEKNAEKYFEKSKKAKKKLKGAEKAIEKTRLKLDKIKDMKVEKPKSIDERKAKKREWYEKFHWFISSDGFLVIGGRDATTNEIVIKKYTDPRDLVFHTDMAGSPFVVIKSEGKKVPETTINETGDFTLAYSRAWRSGLTTSAVFYVKPGQITKEANTGEFLPRGAFMIRGETNYVDVSMNFAVGIHEDKAMGGPISAISKHCKERVEVVQGKEKTSDIAKKIKAKIGGDLDEIIRVLPAGGAEVKK